MIATTSAGIAAGLSVGSNLPTPSETTDGVYVVVANSGTPTAPAPVVALAPPDCSNPRGMLEGGMRAQS